MDMDMDMDMEHGHGTWTWNMDMDMDMDMDMGHMGHMGHMGRRTLCGVISGSRVCGCCASGAMSTPHPTPPAPLP